MSSSSSGRAPLWDPKLASHLSTICLEAAGFTGESYGTTRWMRRDPCAERLHCRSYATGGHVANLLEALPDDIAARFAGLDFELEARDSSLEQLDVLSAAWSMFEHIPALERSISALVKSVHLLKSAGMGYDVSHSAPDLPCSIFLSVPSGESHAVLRVAESIVHEAMHLQLTLIDQIDPLVVIDGDLMAYSPWQRRERPLLGIVHGLYVFRAIDDFLGAIEGVGLDAVNIGFISKRRQEIAEEIHQVAPIAGAPDLTAAGRALVMRLLALAGAAERGNPGPSR